MKKSILFIFCGICILQSIAQSWKPAGDLLKTSWASQVNPANPLSEYPRPQMERGKWFSLNGLWSYTISQRGNGFPKDFDGRILVPFPIESSLSGVQKRVGENQDLWYQRAFTIPEEWKRKDVLLNFEIGRAHV